MSEYKIAVIVGSLRRDSFNRKLAGGLMAALRPERLGWQPSRRARNSQSVRSVRRLPSSIGRGNREE